jgi:hypothetical protein
MPVLREKLLRWGRVIIGGPLGFLAWSISGFSALAIIMWGINTVALPLLMLKTASWGIWGFGVFRESKSRTRELKKNEPPSPPTDYKP